MLERYVGLDGPMFVGEDETERHEMLFSDDMRDCPMYPRDFTIHKIVDDVYCCHAYIPRLRRDVVITMYERDKEDHDKSIAFSAMIFERGDRVMITFNTTNLRPFFDAIVKRFNAQGAKPR